MTCASFSFGGLVARVENKVEAGEEVVRGEGAVEIVFGGGGCKDGKREGRGCQGL